MKKICIFLLIASFFCTFTTACSNTSQKQNMIQSKRRFASYVEPQDTKDPSVIDLSEGPKINYNANFGPRNLNFDIKLVDPY